MNVDTALQERETSGNPIRIGLIGAGATGRAIALQLGTPVPGMRLVAIANRTPEHVERALREAGFHKWARVASASAAEEQIARGVPALTTDAAVLTSCKAIDIVVEVTGSIEPAANVVLDALKHRKHIVLVNAELDSLLGPILKAKADEAGVVITHTDGDEPGVAMTLLRYLRTLGLRVVAAGNIKGMVDYYRNPDTQRGFAEKHDQDVKKVTSFADSTKLSMETTVLANATGFHVPGAEGCTVQLVSMCARLESCYLPMKCSQPVLWITRSGRLRILEHLRWSTRMFRSKRPSWPITRWATDLSMSCTRHSICRTFRSRLRSVARSCSWMPRSLPLADLFARLLQLPSAI